eukprot:TRINITY_DN3327_c0_g1_i1.p1 TRINITY_DN3327_c0_g1~~TRINITY_DN3327_c0_g1_i1.p1  ORF type:complete len:1815 (+),score=537.80 TRINITY_DN3327_c0_g1_i1:40-5445(+)
MPSASLLERVVARLQESRLQAAAAPPKPGFKWFGGGRQAGGEPASGSSSEEEEEEEQQRRGGSPSPPRGQRALERGRLLQSYKIIAHRPAVDQKRAPGASRMEARDFAVHLLSRLSDPARGRERVCGGGQYPAEDGAGSGEPRRTLDLLRERFMEEAIEGGDRSQLGVPAVGESVFCALLAEVLDVDGDAMQRRSMRMRSRRRTRRIAERGYGSESSESTSSDHGAGVSAAGLWGVSHRERRLREGAYGRLFKSIDYDKRGRVTWEQFTMYLIQCGYQGMLGNVGVPIRHYTLKAYKYTTALLSITKATYAPELNHLLVVGEGSDSLRERRVHTVTNPVDPSACEVRLKMNLPRGDDCGTVTSMCYMSSYHVIAVGSSDCAIRFFDAQRGRQLRLGDGEPVEAYRDPLLLGAPPTAMAFCVSRNRGVRRLCVGSRFGDLLGFDFQYRSGALAAVLTLRARSRPHTDTVTALLSLPRGGGLVSASLDGKCVLQDPGDFGEVTRFVGGGGINDVAYCRDYNFLVTGGFEWDVLLWLFTSVHTKPFRLQDKLAPHAATIVSVAAVPGTPQVFSADAHGVIKVWDVRSLQCVQTIDVAKDFAGRAMMQQAKLVVVALVHCPPPDSAGGGSRLMLVSNRRTWTYEFESVSCVVDSADDAQIVAVAYKAETKTFLTASTGSVKLWDSGNGLLLDQITYPRHRTAGGITALALSTNGRKFYVGCHSGLLTVHNASSGVIVSEVSGVDSEVTRIVCAGRYTMVCSWRTVSALLDAGSGVGTRRIPVLRGQQYKATDVSTKLSLLAVGDAAGVIKLRILPTFDKVLDWRPYGDSDLVYREGEVSTLRFLTGLPVLLAGYANGDVLLWCTRAGPHRLRTLVRWQLPPASPTSAFPGVATDVGWLGKSNCVYVGDEQGFCHVYDVSAAVSYYGLRAAASPRRQSTAPSPGKPIIECGSAKTAPSLLHRWKAHDDTLRALLLLDDGWELCVTCSSDQRVKVWSSTGCFLGLFDQHKRAEYLGIVKAARRCRETDRQRWVDRSLAARTWDRDRLRRYALPLHVYGLRERRVRLAAVDAMTVLLFLCTAMEDFVSATAVAHAKEAVSRLVSPGKSKANRRKSSVLRHASREATAMRSRSVCSPDMSPVMRRLSASAAGPRRSGDVMSPMRRISHRLAGAPGLLSPMQTGAPGPEGMSPSGGRRRSIVFNPVEFTMPAITVEADDSAKPATALPEVPGFLSLAFAADLPRRESLAPSSSPPTPSPVARARPRARRRKRAAAVPLDIDFPKALPEPEPEPPTPDCLDLRPMPAIARRRSRTAVVHLCSPTSGAASRRAAVAAAVATACAAQPGMVRLWAGIVSAAALVVSRPARGGRLDRGALAELAGRGMEKRRRRMQRSTVVPRRFLVTCPRCKNLPRVADPDAVPWAVWSCSVCGVAHSRRDAVYLCPTPTECTWMLCRGCAGIDEGSDSPSPTGGRRRRLSSIGESLSPRSMTGSLPGSPAALMDSDSPASDRLRRELRGSLGNRLRRREAGPGGMPAAAEGQRRRAPSVPRRDTQRWQESEESRRLSRFSEVQGIKVMEEVRRLRESEAAAVAAVEVARASLFRQPPAETAAVAAAAAVAALSVRTPETSVGADASAQGCGWVLSVCTKLALKRTGAEGGTTVFARPSADRPPVPSTPAPGSPYTSPRLLPVRPRTSPGRVRAPPMVLDLDAKAPAKQMFDLPPVCPLGRVGEQPQPPLPLAVAVRVGGLRMLGVDVRKSRSCSSVSDLTELRSQAAGVVASGDERLFGRDDMRRLRLGQRPRSAPRPLPCR